MRALALLLVCHPTFTADDLRRLLDLLKWVAHVLPSGVLAEQVNPYSGVPLSVSLLT